MLCREKMTVDEKSKQYLNAVDKLIADHQDVAIIKPMPIETIIVGCKYDLMER